MRIKVVFQIRTKSDQYTKNIKCKTNVSLNCKNELFDYMN